LAEAADTTCASHSLPSGALVLAAEVSEVTELEIYRRAIERIANLNCRSCERYVALVDAIAIDALVAVQNLDQTRVVNDVIARPLPRAA
jgi:hypothetical protein